MIKANAQLEQGPEMPDERDTAVAKKKKKKKKKKRKAGGCAATQYNPTGKWVD